MCRMAFRYRFFFPASSARVAESLFYVLGGGWEFCNVPALPFTAPLDLVFMVEFGSVEVNTLLKFEIFLRDPSGVELVLGSLDAAVADSASAVKRYCASATLQMRVDTTGVHELGLRSGGIRLARYPLEIKLMTPGWGRANGNGV